MSQSNRATQRHSLYENLLVSYEGFAGAVSTRVPDLSTSGMFFHCAEQYPEGAVLRVRFLLPCTNVQIEARAEVRHCVAGVGVGVEFIHLDDEQSAAIEHELSYRFNRLEGKNSWRDHLVN